MAETLLINEIYLSVQGESTYVGLPCIFVRLTGCDLRCNFCDSVYSFSGGQKISLEEIIHEVSELNCDLVEITGGEPLLQKNVIPLMKQLCDLGKKVLLETSGAHDISNVDERVVRIVDLKCPSSGEESRNLWENLDHLRSHDELKFVIGSRLDFEWARDCVVKHSLNLKVNSVLFSPVFKISDPTKQIKGHVGLEAQQLVEWILEEKLPVRMQIQAHKFIWEPTQRGV